MTYKQIMINNVDVSGCEFALETIDTDRIKCCCTKGLTKMSCNQPESIRRDWCDQNPDCLYKQYSRKKQECEEWKKCNEKLLQALIKDQSEIVQKNIDETNILLTKENANLQQQLKTKDQECMELKAKIEYVFSDTSPNFDYFCDICVAKDSCNKNCCFEQIKELIYEVE